MSSLPFAKLVYPVQWLHIEETFLKVQDVHWELIKIAGPFKTKEFNNPNPMVQLKSNVDF